MNLLVNNAGIALEGFDAKMTEETLATNYWATKDMILEALPQMAKEGRVVVSSKQASAKTSGRTVDASIKCNY